MPDITVKELLEAGCHFGHQTSRWNPKMKPYIFGVKNGIHILNLDKTVEYAKDAFKVVSDKVALGGYVLFVGTKRQASDIVREQAERVGQYYVNQRWLGGMLTNFKTIKASIDRLHSLYQRRDSGDFAKFTKKEALTMERDIEKLEHSLGGIKNMTRLPSVVFIVDPKTEKIALLEAKRLKLPVVAITDTNCDPDGIEHLIPANDDAIRSITLLVSHVANACEEGTKRREAVMREETERSAKEAASRPAGTAPAGRVQEKKMTDKPRAYVAEARPAGNRGGPGKKGPHSHAGKGQKTLTEKKAEEAKGEKKAEPTKTL